MRVEYRIGFNQWISEWVCFEHTGYARAKAEAWWRERSTAPVPATAAEAVDLANRGALADTLAVSVRSVAGEKYDTITGHELDEPPDVQAGELPDYDFARNVPCPF
jgi:DNA repair protein RadD